MTFFTSNKYNEDYLNIARYDIVVLTLTEEIPADVRQEICDMQTKLYSMSFFELFGVVEKIVIRKDSLFGKYLLDNCNKNVDDDLFRKEDEFIYYSDVVNALNIALFEGDKIAEAIMPLFKKQVVGPKAVLLKEYDNELLDYILNNKNFMEHISPETELEEDVEDSVVYENGEFYARNFFEEKKSFQKTK